MLPQTSLQERVFYYSICNQPFDRERAPCALPREHYFISPKSSTRPIMIILLRPQSVESVKLTLGTLTESCRALYAHSARFSRHTPHSSTRSPPPETGPSSEGGASSVAIGCLSIQTFAMRSTNILHINQWRKSIFRFHLDHFTAFVILQTYSQHYRPYRLPTPKYCQLLNPPVLLSLHFHNIIMTSYRDLEF